MTRNREMPEKWQTEELIKSSPQPNSRLPGQTAKDKYFRTPAELDKIDLPSPTVVPLPTPEIETAASSPQQRWNLLNWKICGVLIVLFSGGLGYGAMSTLLKLPAVPDCHDIFLPFTSASTRLSCAQIAADKNNVEDTLEAIHLVENLPKDHPLRPEINRLVAELSLDVLKFGERKFQEGDLEGAIATAKEVPSHAEAYELVEDKITKWESIWTEAQEDYEAAEKQLKQSHWNLAFREAVRLTYSDNKYWATIKYREMVAQINQGRLDSAKLDEAYKAIRRGGADNLLKAIEISQVIKSDSYAHKEAQDLIGDAVEKLMSLAYKALDNSNWSLAAKIANKLPANLKDQDKIDEIHFLSDAGSRAQLGTISSLESAIFSAQKIQAESSLHNKATKLISRWQLEIEDVAYLEEARRLARPGRVRDLRAAIAKAQLIPRYNPRYEEAQSKVRSWTREVQLAEDRPILDRATQLARYDGGVASLQDAINEASQINSSRPLYGEAQNKIQQWSSSIQRQQDQPLLNQAERLASSGNLLAAIDTARRIRSGRNLHSEAQGKIRGWQREINARDNLQRAYRVAASQTPEALAQAIRTARQVPNGTSASRERNQAINNWSYQMLEIAQRLANNSSIKEAIKVAKLIPSGTAAYSVARTRINTWRAVLAPPPIIIETKPAPLPPPLPPVTEADFSLPRELKLPKPTINSKPKVEFTESDS